MLLELWLLNVPGKGTGYPAPSPQIRTSGTTASGSSVLILLTKPETNQAVPRLAHNFATLPAILDVVDDPGHRKGELVINGIQIFMPINVAFVGSATQPVPPKSPRMMMNTAQCPIVTNYAIVLIVTSELDTQHLVLLI